jgi:phosphatidylinositol 3,5-bisphosphate 5-phosphatase
MIGDANGQYGGIKKAGEACAVIGFIRFLRGHYMVVATKRKCVGAIGKHKIYAIESTQDYYIPNPAYLDRRRDTSAQPANGTAGVGSPDADEEKYRNLFLKFDLTKDFYLSYTYDLSSNLQQNMTRPKHESEFPSYTDMFVWNHFLLEPFNQSVKSAEHRLWVCPIIHGSFVQHSTISASPSPRLS